MHSYSIDRDLRVKVATILFVVAMLVSVFFSVFLGDVVIDITNGVNNSKVKNIILMLNWIGAIPDLFGVSIWYAILTLFYKKVAWKWKWVKCFHGIPDLNGDWKGKLKSSFNNKEITMIMSIEQDWNKISIKTEFPKTSSVSYSNVAAIYVDSNKGVEIFFGYENESQDLENGLQVHYGYNILNLKNNNEIIARYFNDRINPDKNIKGGNKGTFELKKVNATMKK